MEDKRDAVIDRAVRDSIVINALDAKGLWSEPPVRPFGEEPQTTRGFPIQAFVFETSSVGARNSAITAAMAEFAGGTGGLFFHNNNDLAGGFAELSAVPMTRYLLAIKPGEEAAVGKYHRLSVKLTKRKGDAVQARPGYFAPGNAPPETPRKLDTEALATDTVAEIPVQLAGRLGRTENGDQTLSLLIHVDIAHLKFTESWGRQAQKLAFIGALMDTSGNMATAKEGAMELMLKPESLAQMRAKGLNAELTFGALPGSYVVRVVVQDAEGRMAALTQNVQIPK